MNVKLIGLKGVNYVSKKDGKEKLGIELQCIRHPNTNEASSSLGMILCPVYISSESEIFNVAQSLKPDTNLDLIYEYDGRFSYLSDIKIFKGGENHE